MDVRMPDGMIIRNVPDGMTREDVLERYNSYIADLNAKPESGLVPAVKAGFSGLQEAGYSLLGRTGLMDEAAAERAIEEEKAYQRRTFAPTKEGWTEAPLTKTAELLGGSLPYMAAPLAAGAGIAALPLTGAAATVAGLGAAGLTSAAQFTGTNLARQMDAGKRLGETDLGAAALAAVPQAALDMVSFKMLPGIRQIFAAAGKKLPEAAALQIAKQGTANVAKDYVLATGRAMGVEGVTEAGQQFFERLQAGLNLADEQARDEYWESLIGGAVLGGVLAPAGRFYERGREQAAEDKKQRELQAAEAKKRAEDEAWMAQTREAEESAFKQTPEYRQQLNSKLLGLQDEMATLETALREKTIEPEVKQEAVKRAQELRKELAATKKEMRESMLATGAAQTLEQVKAAAEAKRATLEPGQVVDEFGNIVKTKTLPVSEEEEALGYDRFVAQQEERRALLERLREKEFAENERKRAKQEKEVQGQINRWMTSMEEAGDLYTADMVRQVAEKQKRKEQDAAQEMTFDRINLVLNKFGLRAAGLQPEERQRVESSINEGRVDRFVTQALGITGLEGRTFKAADALPQIEARIAKLEEKRVTATQNAKQLMEDNGQLTKAGYALVADEARLNELKRLRDIAAQQKPAETPAEQAIEGTLQAEFAQQGEAPAVEIDPTKGVNFYSGRAGEAQRARKTNFLDIAALLEDFRSGRVFGQRGRTEGRGAEQLKFASMTEDSLIAETDRQREAMLNAAIDEAAYRRAAEQKNTLTVGEAIKLRKELNDLLRQFFKRSTALPKNHPEALVERMVEPAQMRGTELVKPAVYERVDPRQINQLPFENQREASAFFESVLENKINEYVEAGAKERKVIRPLLKPTREAPVTDLKKDIEKVLDMPGLKPEVAALLDEARTRIVEGRASDDLIDLVDEQVGRILRGTDRPFEGETEMRRVKERDVTKPARVEMETPAATAELAGAIQEQMRADDIAQRYAEGDQNVLETRKRGARGAEFVEKPVQEDLFPATLATERETPKAWDKYTASKEVAKLREKVAESRSPEEKAKITNEIRARIQANQKRTTLQAQLDKLDADYERSIKNVEQKAKEIDAAEKADAAKEGGERKGKQFFASERLKNTPESLGVEYRRRREALLDKFDAIDAEEKEAIESFKYVAPEVAAKRRAEAELKKAVAPETQYAEQLQTVKDLYTDILEQKQTELLQEESLMRRELKRLDGLENSIRKQQSEGKITYTVMANKLLSVANQRAKAQEDFDAKYQEFLKKDAAEMARLDGRMQIEFKHLKTLEKRVQEAKKGSPEQRAARAAAQKIRGVLVKAEQEHKKQRDTRLRTMRAAQELVGRLPTTIVTTERVEAGKKGKIFTRRRIMQVRSREETQLAAEERRKEEATEALALSKERAENKRKNGMIQLEEAQRKMAAVQEKLKTVLKPAEIAEALALEKELGKQIAKLKKDTADLQEAIRISARLEKAEPVRPSRSYSPSLRTGSGAEMEAIAGALERRKARGKKSKVEEAVTQMEGREAFEAGDLIEEYTRAMNDYGRDSDIDFRIGEEAGGIEQAVADKRGAELKKAMPEGIKFEYYPDASSMPQAVKDNLAAQGLLEQIGLIRGGVMPDGTVFVVGANHTSLAEMEKTVAHEFIGHYSFEGVVGPEGMVGLLKKVDANLGGVFKLAETLGVSEQAMAAYLAGSRMGMTKEQAQVKALKEVIAYTTEKRVDATFLEKAKNWIKELVGAFRAALRSMGLMDAGNFSTNDLFYLIKEAENNFKNGRAYAYTNAEGDVSFAATTARYPADLAALGATADKLIGKKRSWWDGVKAAASGLTFRTYFVDRFAGLEALLKQGVDKGIIDSLKAADAMYFARMADQRHSFVAEIATNGTLQISDTKRADGRIEKVVESKKGASLRDISAALQESGITDSEANSRLFMLYLTAERAQRVGKNRLNFSADVSDAELKDALAFGRNNPAFQKARELYNEYNKGLIDFAVQAGAISKELGAKLNSTGDYVPYYRDRKGVIELVIGNENPIRIGDLKNQPYLQELVGGNEVVLDFFTAALQNTNMLTDMALRNLATRNAAYALSDVGVLKRKSDKDFGIHKGSGPATPNTIRFYRDGEAHWAELDPRVTEDAFGDIPADLVVKGMEGIQVTMPAVIRGLAVPANILRKFITRDPRYAIRQIFRDSMSAALTTGANIMPVVDTLKEIRSLYKKESEGGSILQRRGVVGGQVITGAPGDMEKVLQQLSSGKPGWAMAMSKLDQLAMMGDAATRVALYNSFIKQGLSDREATMATLESMNFGRRGISPSIYALNAMIPFFNAGIQGIDVAYRAFTGKMPESEKLNVQRKLFTRGLFMAGFTMVYAALMQDDEAYKNAPLEQRLANWFIRIPGIDEPFRVPIPFEMGLIFKAIPEGIANMASGEDKGKMLSALGMQTLRSLPGGIADTGAPVPAAIKPVLEVMLNKSFYTGRDIVGGRMAGLDPEEQFGEKTPELLKALGQHTGLSPALMEQLVRGYTGALGIGLLSLLNPVARVTPSEERGAVEMRVSDIPLIGGLFQPNDASRVVNDAYETMVEVNQRKRTFDKLVEEGRKEAAQRYLEENISDISLVKQAGKFRQQMGKYAAYERSIRAAPPSEMSPAEKRKRLDEVKQLKIAYAKQFSELRAEIGRQAVR